jgi:hypothetical protein
VTGAGGPGGAAGGPNLGPAGALAGAGGRLETAPRIQAADRGREGHTFPVRRGVGARAATPRRHQLIVAAAFRAAVGMAASEPAGSASGAISSG